MQQELSRSVELTSNRPISSSSANSQLDEVDDASPTSMPTSHTEFQIVVNQSMQANKRRLASQFKSSSNTTHPKQTDSDNDDDDDEAISVDDNEEVHDDDYDSDISDQHNFPKDDSTSYILSDENTSDSSDDNEVEDDDEALLPLNGSKQRRNNEETMIGITANPSDLSSIVYNLLQRVRKLIKFIRKSSVLDRYIFEFRNQIRLKSIEIIRSAHEQSVKSVKLNNAVLEFRIRWNTTYIMISRFIALSSIITDITLLSSIEIVSPGLKIFLTTIKDDQPLENPLQQLLLAKFSYYFEQEISWEQKRATLIAAFLDPTSYRYLTDENISEAERTLLSEFDVTQSFDRLQIDTSVTTTLSISTSTPLGHQRIQNRTTRQEKSTLDEFFACAKCFQHPM
ncbi:unnamed protein product [Rotaria socialis]